MAATCRSAKVTKRRDAIKTCLPAGVSHRISRSRVPDLMLSRRSQLKRFASGSQKSLSSTKSLMILRSVTLQMVWPVFGKTVGFFPVDDRPRLVEPIDEGSVLDVGATFFRAAAQAEVPVSEPKHGFCLRQEIVIPTRAGAQHATSIARRDHGRHREGHCRVWPGIPVVPTTGAAATDSTYLRNAGIPAYCTSGLADDLDDFRAHGKDGRVPVKSFFEGQEYLYRLVKILSGGE